MSYIVVKSYNGKFKIYKIGKEVCQVHSEWDMELSEVKQICRDLNQATKEVVLKGVVQ